MFNLLTESEDNGCRLNSLTLEFTGLDDRLETFFLDDYFKRSIGHLRNCHLYTIFFYGIAGLIDWFLFPEYLLELFSIRFLLVVPVFIAGFFFSFTSLYRHCWQQVSFFYILLTGGSFIAFILIPRTPEASEYYVGMLYCMMFGYTFIRERFIHASAAGLFLVVAYFTVSVFVAEMPAHTVLLSNFFLILANFLGMLIARHLEISARRDFYLEHRLSLEQERTQKLNEELEIRVAERTYDLEQSNTMLKTKIEALFQSEAERTKLEAQLRQAYKMEAIGALAGGIAHDFNNILTSTMGYTEIALLKTEKASPIKGYLHEIYRASERAKELVRQILAFARQSEEAPRQIQLGPIVKEVIKLLRSSIPSSIQIKQHLNSKAFILGDPVNVHQILMNLATNASHAMEDGGILEITADDITLDDTTSGRLAELDPGDYIRLSVSDTGHGIPPETMETIFEPYFTTKAPGEGTGMGLAMVYGIVKKYKGAVIVDSKPEEGAVFTVYLPATDRPEKKKSHQHEALPTGTERILMVDDELAIAEIGRLILSDQKYRVTTSGSSRKALELFRSNPEAFDLIITDMTMPEMTGDKLATAMMEIRPDIPVILYTGYNKNMTEEKMKKIGIRAVAYKPIGRIELIRTVRKVLDGTPSSDA